LDFTSSPKKRLLFVAYNFPPNGEAGTQRSFRFVKYLSKLNWDLLVLTADPQDYLPGTPVDVHYLEALPSDLAVIRSSVFRGLSKAIQFRNSLRNRMGSEPPKHAETSSPVNKSPKVLSRFQQLKDFIALPFTIPDNHSGWFWGSLVRGWFAMRRQPVDLIYSSGPPWTSHLIAYALSKISRVPWVADFRDPWARSPWRVNRSKSQKAMADLMEKAVVYQARFIILNTEWTKKEFLHFYQHLASDKFQLIPNGYEPETFDVIKQTPSTGEDSFRLVHAGSLYGGRDPVPLLKAWALFIQQMTSSPTHFLLSLVGVRDERKDALHTIVRQLGLEQHVDLVPRVSHAASLQFMAKADVLLLLQGGQSLSVPSKLFEYMALNKAVLGLTPAGAAADILERYPLGKIVNPNDSDEILAGILSFFDERNHVVPRKEIDEFIKPYQALNLTKKLDHVLNQALLKA